MKQKLCVVLGIAMIAYVGAAVSGVVKTSDSMFMQVGKSEAQKMIGGGGSSNFTASSCFVAGTGCTVVASGYKNNGGTGQKPWGTATWCGGTCGSVYTYYKTAE